MQGHMVRSWAPLGVLLLCLHLPGLSARSIGAAEEKAAQDLGANAILPGQPSSTGPSNSEHPQSKPDPESNDLRSVPLSPSASPSDGSQPAGGPGAQSWPQYGGLPYLDSWASEEPLQMTATGDEDAVGGASPQGLYFFSNDADLPPGNGPSPAGSSEHPSGAQPETSLSQKDPKAKQPPLSNMGAQEQTSTERPFWNLINRIRQSILSGRPCGLLKPRGPLGGRGPASGVATRPMPQPGGLGGIKNPQFGGLGGIKNPQLGGLGGIKNPQLGGLGGIKNPNLNTGWGNINRIPGIGGGNMNHFPGMGGGNVNGFPGIGGGNMNGFPGINNLFPPGVAQPAGPSWSSSPGWSNPENVESQ
ncbi:PREDICTED: uncharacterized protein C6orf15 homolog [Condylura cristata]|uniref:uncharacterized protein C6orf15 homolog n=1 Tax=Condylura cristata TaxID=143302 RepID=UPI0003345929|nr:PREDICTED: uncharacterized protein C6orf15 homolog [Condylura cristata]